MNTYVAMLRGVNVGGRRQIKMEDLKALFVSLGHLDVVTYIQSGNVIFNSPVDSPSELARGVEHRIMQNFGLSVRMVLRTRAELAAIMESNSFLLNGVAQGELHVTFLADVPDQSLLGNLREQTTDPDEFRIRGREVYLHCPGGYGRTKLNNAFWERRLGMTATTRNWNTVTRLFQLASPWTTPHPPDPTDQADGPLNEAGHG